MEIKYKVIGIVHSEFKDKKSTPIQSIFSESKGTVEVFPEYAEGLKDIDGFSHLYLIYHFNQAEGCMLVQKPFVDGSKERGIFSIRHFNRPNPIGISLVELKGVKGNILEIDGVDILDGTPLLDIKPYVRQFDHRDDVRCGWVDQKNMEDHKGKKFTPEGLEEK
ncbi:tRNA (N6-threonylcarbamoyladenosine(37)-N6)-methyltransferase TrmO [Methanocella sp. CWC-04]|uniref:tRNA (N6-threonylcarbamoyladenosine(37)-N6)-methyltransferase TrmO n=1 Tax=Methanooceanicella nereidis TaxID=2052831 RepID=A0AAP2W5G4_9EURY|nr:tRNA (N6-threonylcarbamoyladenosine(37)-N6)-methyltransferase TrmO [Methanocella sp. CWC-04]MCD1294283.1 tRNA (N6-threonylcarbamoyladenosine(37)-N6)-methyltransferase TrmO [Methanocella sp. CWC-04]